MCADQRPPQKAQLRSAELGPPFPLALLVGVSAPQRLHVYPMDVPLIDPVLADRGELLGQVVLSRVPETGPSQEFTVGPG